MNTFSVLYRYECKKLFQKKMVWVCLILCIMATLMSCFADLIGDVYIDGERIDNNYHYMMTDITYMKELNGRAIDQTLLEEMVAAYRQIPDIPGRHYISSEEYQQIARPYSDIYNFVRLTTMLQSSQIMYEWEPDEQEFYQMQKDFFEEDWSLLRLTEGEKQFWRNQRAKIETPLVYQECHTYSRLYSRFQGIGFFALLMQAICLAGVFSDEYSRRTDQLNLCTVNGRKGLYWAKLLAGISFAGGASLLLAILSFVSVMILYGKGNPSALLQFAFRFSAEPLSCGQALLIADGLMIVTVILVAVFTMFLSELTHSNVATLSIVGSLLTLAMITNIPESLRILSQLWLWLPFNILSVYHIFNAYTLPLFGMHLTAWQALPFIYLAVGIGLVLMGKRIYRGRQISGR